jgi:hypothetical protein
MHGFPNLFLVQPTQGAGFVSNFTHVIVEAGASIATIIEHTLTHGKTRVEPTREAESRWLELLLSGGAPILQRIARLATTTTRASTRGRS